MVLVLTYQNRAKVSTEVTASPNVKGGWNKFVAYFRGEGGAARDKTFA